MKVVLCGRSDREKPVDRDVQRHRVAADAKADDHPCRDLRQERVVTKGFALVHVRDMHLEERDRHAGERIAQRDAGVRQATRVDDDVAGAVEPRRVDAVDQGAFVVALKALHRHPARRAERDRSALDVGQRVVAVDLRLARAEQVQVGTVEQKDLGHGVVSIQPSMLSQHRHGALRRRMRPGSGAERCSTSSPSHTAERRARSATTGSGIC